MPVDQTEFTCLLRNLVHQTSCNEMSVNCGGKNRIECILLSHICKKKRVRMTGPTLNAEVQNSQSKPHQNGSNL
jgi:hypothetical protein